MEFDKKDFVGIKFSTEEKLESTLLIMVYNQISRQVWDQTYEYVWSPTYDQNRPQLQTPILNLIAEIIRGEDELY